MPAPDAGRLLEAYLHEVAQHLPDPARARRDVVDELRDGLLEAASAHRCAGLAPRAAIRTATAQFGTPAQVAAAHAPELGIRQSRRSSWHVLRLLLTTGRLLRHGLPDRCGRTLAVAVAAALGAQVLAMSTILATGGSELWTGSRMLGSLLLAGLVGGALVESLRAARSVQCPLARSRHAPL